MKKKIIYLRKMEEDHKCLFCGENQATVKMVINRPKYDDIVNAFYVCDTCVAQMQKDIETCD